MATPEFRTEFTPCYGQAITIAENIQRITCNNPSPFTFHGTNSYIIGHDRLIVIDPGPLDQHHLAALIRAIDSRPVSHILITHTHIDHSPLAKKLAEQTGAPLLAQGPHCAARALNKGEANKMDASGDHDFTPDQRLKHGDKVQTDGFTLEAIHTPGHTANHMAFALEKSDFLFSGDHVMAWATTIVAPPDGAMGAYMTSLDRLLHYPQQTYFPGHGGRLDKAHQFIRALKAHRKMRETAILSQIRKGKTTISDIVATIYKTTDKKLHGAARLSVFAHIEDLFEKGLISCDGPPSLEGHYKAV